MDGGDDDVVHSVITGRGGDAPFWLRAMVVMATLTLTSSKQPSKQPSKRDLGRCRLVSAERRTCAVLQDAAVPGGMARFFDRPLAMEPFCICYPL